MSWSQWPVGAPTLPPVVAAAAAAAAAPNIMAPSSASTFVSPPTAIAAPPGMQCSTEQWAQMQQQNWQQWAQWQQQYQQWHQQYGAEYQKSLSAYSTAGGLGQPPLPPVTGVPPPYEQDAKPPLPVEEPPKNYNTTETWKQQPKASGGQWQPMTRQPRPDGGSNNDANDRPKRMRPNEGKGWNVLQKVNPEELSEAEKKFDKQFADWEAQFNKWKEQNAGHPDKAQYLEYEKKWETWRAQLLERREQMRKKRLSLTMTPPNTSNQGEKRLQIAPTTASESFTSHLEDFNRPPPTVNNEPLEFKTKPIINIIEDIRIEPPEKKEFDLSFLKKDTGGIPGLDLVKEGQTDEKFEENENENKKASSPDYEALSKGINSILGDKNLLNVLSLVSKSQNLNQQNNFKPAVEKQFDNDYRSIGYSETEKPSSENLNIDEQTRSSFHLGEGQVGRGCDGERTYNESYTGRELNFSDKPDNFRNQGFRRDSFENRGPNFASESFRPDRPNNIQPNNFKGAPGNYNRPPQTFSRNSDEFNNRQPESFNNEPPNFNRPPGNFGGKFNNFQAPPPNNRGDFKPFGRRPTFAREEEESNSELVEEDNWNRNDEYCEEDSRFSGSMDKFSQNGTKELAQSEAGDDEILKPTVVIDYDHKSRKTDDIDVMVEPLLTFDYRHKQVNRIPIPQRPKWLLDATRNIREFEPQIRLLDVQQRRFEPWNYSTRSYHHPIERRHLPDHSRGGFGEEEMWRRPQPPPEANEYDEGEEKRPRWEEKQGNWGEKRGEWKEKKDDWEENNDWDERKTVEEKAEVVEKKGKKITLIEDLLCPPGRFNRPLKIVIILRGPPGSGKTTLAKLIKDKEVENGGSAPRILSLDDYFMVEQEKEVTEEGKVVKVKEMVYEYEEEMEASYRTSLMKSFKKTVTDGYFNFIVIDNVNDKVKYFGEMWSFAKQNGFQVYICQLHLDVQTCSKRNIHGRSEADIERCVKGWEVTPDHHPLLDATSLLQSGSIAEVEMEEINSPPTDFGSDDGNEEETITSKWDTFDCSIDNLAKLDGTSKPLRASRTMEDYLQLDDEWAPKTTTKPGQKRVRWADLEEQREQARMRAIGFVVGQTDWDRMLDPTQGGSALTQTKYIDRVTRH